VLGDPELETETSNNLETNLEYDDGDTRLSLAVFRQDVKHYIERLTVNDELRQYRNLTQAEVHGVSYQWQTQFDWQNLYWKLKLGGQWLHGQDRVGAPIADIAPAQHRLSLTVLADDSQGFVAMTHRQSSNDIVSGELPTSSVASLDAGYTYQWDPQLQFSLNMSNLTNKLYVTSRDELAPYARGRDIHVTLRYSL